MNVNPNYVSHPNNQGSNHFYQTQSRGNENHFDESTILLDDIPH